MTSPDSGSRVTPSFNDASVIMAPARVQLRRRDAFYHLVNVEEHPEILPLAFDIVTQVLGAASGSTLTKELGAFDTPAPASLPGVLERCTEWRARFAAPWKQASGDLTRRQVLHYFTQFMPTALVDGCWLQCALRVSTAHTPVGASLTGLYADQLHAYTNDPERHFVADYRAVSGRLGAPVEEVSSHSFAERADFQDHSFALPIFLLSIAQFTRAFSPEILGVNLAWQFLDLSAFGPTLIRELCSAYELPRFGDDLGRAEHLDKLRRMARAAVVDFMERGEAPGQAWAWERILRGATACVELVDAWYAHTGESAPSGAPDPRRAMLDLLSRKAPHATGYHREKKLGERRIDEHLDPRAFDGPALLDELARSPWVKPGQSDGSALLRHLVKFGGPMQAVFSPAELHIIQTWIDSLPPRDAGTVGAGAAHSGDSSLPKVLAPRGEATVAGRAWTPREFRLRADRLLGHCSIRELFYYLINVERHPEVLPVAERYARDRLERSLAMVWKGERPIPSRHYTPEALERWVHAKHRQQLDSYRPPAVRSPAPKEEFVEATVQLAPIVLIDGGWLQGIATPVLIHTVVGRMLFHVLVEEIGAGNAKEHHANIYRDLLAAMGQAAPPVESWEFARWPRLKDSSFDVPTLWLAISCFPRHFLPEILGLNLAVEIAGIGGPYMEARDALKSFGLPTLFVDVHNAADNVAAGHSAWAMNTIKRYMDEVAERDGPHSVDRIWHRVWSGVRSTLPQIGRLKLIAHRLKGRLLGADPTGGPVIFPS
jgi:hypothetical protein